MILYKWPVIKEIVKVLEAVHIAMKEIQKQDFGLSDFFGCWVKVKLILQRFVGLRNKKTNLAFNLLHAMNNRQQLLIDTPMMSAAIYLDPRFHSELGSIQIAQAKTTLEKLFDRAKTIVTSADDVPAVETPAENNDGDDEDEEIDISKIDFLEEYFVSKGFDRIDVEQDTNTINGPNFSLDVIGLRQEFEKFERTPRQHNKANILDIWEILRHEHPELHVLSCIVNSVPASQSEAERSISALSFVFGEKRYNLGEKCLEKILKIKLNKSLFNEVCLEDIEALKKQFEK